MWHTLQVYLIAILKVGLRGPWRHVHCPSTRAHYILGIGTPVEITTLYILMLNFQKRYQRHTGFQKYRCIYCYGQKMYFVWIVQPVLISYFEYRQHSNPGLIQTNYENYIYGGCNAQKGFIQLADRKLQNILWGYRLIHSLTANYRTRKFVIPHPGMTHRRMNWFV